MKSILSVGLFITTFACLNLFAKNKVDVDCAQISGKDVEQTYQSLKGQIAEIKGFMSKYNFYTNIADNQEGVKKAQIDQVNLRYMALIATISRISDPYVREQRMSEVTAEINADQRFATLAKKTDAIVLAKTKSTVPTYEKLEALIKNGKYPAEFLAENKIQKLRGKSTDIDPADGRVAGFMKCPGKGALVCGGFVIETRTNSLSEIKHVALQTSDPGKRTKSSEQKAASCGVSEYSLNSESGEPITLKCASGQSLCNPLVYGAKKDDEQLSAICVEAISGSDSETSAKTNGSCDKVKNAEVVKSLIEFNPEAYRELVTQIKTNFKPQSSENLFASLGVPAQYRVGELAADKPADPTKK